jgi:hypothetical protein
MFLLAAAATAVHMKAAAAGQIAARPALLLLPPRKVGTQLITSLFCSPHFSELRPSLHKHNRLPCLKRLS